MEKHSRQIRPYVPRRHVLACVAALIVSFAPREGQAQTAFVQSASRSFFSSATSDTLTFSSNVKAGNLIAIYVAWTNGTDTLVSVSDNLGNTFDLVQNPTTLGSYGRAAGAYAKNIFGGSCTVTVTFSPGSFAARTIILREIAGADPIAPLDASAALAQFDPGTGADSVTSGPIATSAAGDYIFAATADLGHRSAVNAGAGFTGRETISTPVGAQGADRIQSTTGTVAATFTNTDTAFADFITLVMAFRPRAQPDTTPPTVTVTSPAPAATVSGTVVISADAADDSRLAGVQFQVDGVNLGAECISVPCATSWNTAASPNVTHTLTAQARDASDNRTTSAAIAVSVNNVGAAQSVIGADRRIEWSQAGIARSIPARAICATLDPGATHTDINTAIASCVDGVVFLNPGNYTLSGGVTFSGRSNVTLRGAGPDRTTLTFTGSDFCAGVYANICIHGASTVWSGNVPADNVRSWTAGYSKGTAHITLSSTAGLRAGTILILDQLDDAIDTGGVVVNDTVTFSIEGNSPGRPNRSQQQFVEVVAVNGNEIAISPAIHMPNWRASQQPQAWWWGGPGDTAVMNGVENLTVDHTQGLETVGILFSNAYNGWVSNVKSLNARRSHVGLYQAARIAVRDSYFYGTKQAATQSYGVESFTTSDDLIVNNIFQHVTAPLMTGPNAGSVFAYNYLIDMYYTVSSWMMAGIVGSHDAGTGMNLFEGNVGNQFLMDAYHGPGSLATVFRNRLAGTEPNKTQGNTTPVSIWAYNRLANIVGNVLGTDGYHLVYESSIAGVTGYPERSIYVLGYSGVGEMLVGNVPYDSRVVTSLLRWGNYDYATRTARWNGSEVPTDAALPPDQSLPPSLFLRSRPGWWGTLAWPAIGPDVSGGQDPAGHAQPIPAQRCYEITPRDAGGVLLFNAANCYPAR